MSAIGPGDLEKQIKSYNATLTEAEKIGAYYYKIKLQEILREIVLNYQRGVYTKNEARAVIRGLSLPGLGLESIQETDSFSSEKRGGIFDITMDSADSLAAIAARIIDAKQKGDN
ncbi:hypothetical protein [Pectobacterium aroidearum]|uniref:hypothetical protein n=1 Tax=Pectobacterium aroidearum TaxID=1201031 RepID=UPI0032EAA9CF